MHVPGFNLFMYQRLELILMQWHRKQIESEGGEGVPRLILRNLDKQKQKNLIPKIMKKPIVPKKKFTYRNFFFQIMKYLGGGGGGAD